MKRYLWAWVVLFSLSSLAWAANDGRAKDSYLKKADRELQTVSAKVNSLQKQAEKAGTQTRVELDRQLKTVQEKLGIARRKLTEIQWASEGSWKSLRRGVDETLRDVKIAFENATSLLTKKASKEGKP